MTGINPITDAVMGLVFRIFKKRMPSQISDPKFPPANGRFRGFLSEYFISETVANAEFRCPSPPSFKNSCV